MRRSERWIAGQVVAAALATALLGAASTAARAASVVGEWQGQWSTNSASATANFDLYFVSQSAGGAVTGIFDWTCTSGFTCSGLEVVSGTLNPANQLSLTTTARVQPFVNLAPGNYSADLSVDSQHIVNGVTTGSTFAADRVNGVAPGVSLLQGSWRGTWQTYNRSATADFNLVFTSQVFDGVETDIEGYFDWQCTSGFACFGRELIGGTLGADNSLQFATTGFSGPRLNLAAGSYSMLLIGNGSDMIGLSTGSVLRAQHVSEPASAWLAAAALMLLGGLQRRQRHRR